jgi:hypothetical protein
MAGAVGALAMKALAPRVLRRWGFRRSLIVSGLVSSAGYATCALFRPDWPTAAMIGVLALSGFFLVPVHRLQRDRLCRCREGTDERGDQLLCDLPAADPVAGHLRAAATVLELGTLVDGRPRRRH